MEGTLKEGKKRTKNYLSICNFDCHFGKQVKLFFLLRQGEDRRGEKGRINNKIQHSLDTTSRPSVLKTILIWFSGFS